VEKGTITDPILFTCQEDAKSVEKKTYSYIGVQTMEISSVDPTICKATSVNEEDTIPEVIPENTTHDKGKSSYEDTLSTSQSQE
jgi:hypothetical protein